MEKTKNLDLIYENVNLVNHVIHKYYGSIIRQYDVIEDMQQVGMVSLYQATLLFDEDRGVRFSTFATTKIKNDLCNFIKNELYKNYITKEPSLNDSVGASSEDDSLTLEEVIGNYDDYSFLESNEILSYIREKYNDKTFGIVVLLSEGYTYQAIADKIGLTKQRVNQIIVKMREDIIKTFNVVIKEEKTDGEIIAFNEEGFKMKFKNSQEASDYLGVNKYTIRKILRNKDLKAKNTCKKLNDIIVHFKFA